MPRAFLGACLGWPYLPSRHWRKTPSTGCVMLFSTSPATTPRPIESCAPSGLPVRAWRARETAESHRGLLHARNGSGTRHGPLGSFLWGPAWRGGCRQPSGSKGSLCRGQPPSIMHSNPSLPVATPPVAFRRLLTATRTQIRGAGYSCQWTRDGWSGAEPLRDGALIDSQHFSQQHSQQHPQTSSRDGFFGSRARIRLDLACSGANRNLRPDRSDGAIWTACWS